MNKLKLNKKGVSIIEVLLTLAIFAVIIPIIYFIFFVSNNSFEVGKNRGLAQQEARLIADFLNEELRYASVISDEKNNMLEETFYSLEIKDNSIVKKTYSGQGDYGIEDTIVNANCDIELEYEGNRILKGVIRINNQDANYSLDFNIPLENGGNTDIDGQIALNNNEILYYKYPNNEEVTPW